MTKGDNANNHGPGDAPKAPLRAMRVLEALASEPGGMTLSRLSVRLDAPKTTLLALRSRFFSSPF